MKNFDEALADARKANEIDPRTLLYVKSTILSERRKPRPLKEKPLLTLKHSRKVSTKRSSDLKTQEAKLLASSLTSTRATLKSTLMLRSRPKLLELRKRVVSFSSYSMTKSLSPLRTSALCALERRKESPLTRAMPSTESSTAS